MNGTISFYFSCSSQNVSQHSSSTHITIAEALGFLICANERLALRLRAEKNPRGKRSFQKLLWVTGICFRKVHQPSVVLIRLIYISVAPLLASSGHVRDNRIIARSR